MEHDNSSIENIPNNLNSLVGVQGKENTELWKVSVYCALIEKH